VGAVCRWLAGAKRSRLQLPELVLPEAADHHRAVGELQLRVGDRAALALVDGMPGLLPIGGLAAKAGPTYLNPRTRSSVAVRSHIRGDTPCTSSWSMVNGRRRSCKRLKPCLEKASRPGRHASRWRWRGEHDYSLDGRFDLGYNAADEMHTSPAGYTTPFGKELP
jgi:hypothetical protein